MVYPRCPVDDGGITTEFSDIHQGIDIGWHSNKYCPVYAAYDCTVFEVGKTTKGGLYVKTKWNDGHTDKFEHLKSYSVKKGQRLALGQQLGIRGSSGTAATGVHLDYRIYTSAGKVIDPQDVLYIYQGQVIVRDKKMHMKDKPVYVLAPTVERNTAVHQVQVMKATLRERAGASKSADIIDFAKMGIYNDLEHKDADGYTWIRIGEYQWIASVKDFVVDLPVVTIDALEAQIKELTEKVNEGTAQITFLLNKQEKLNATIKEQDDKMNQIKTIIS